MGYIEHLSIKKTQITSIDDQHQKLVDLFNNFYEKLYKSGTRENLTNALHQMSDYIEYHFGTEEKLFKMHDHPETDKHIFQHNTFREKVESSLKEYKKGDLQLSMELLNFLKDWIINHINDSDQKYSEFLLERGVK